MPVRLTPAPPSGRRRSAGDGRGRWRWPAHRPRRRVSNVAFGISTLTIMWICCFSPWPTPITAFLTALGAYSATASPASAGTSMAMPRAWPSFSVAVASLLTKVCSTAASSRHRRVDAPRPARHATGRAATASAALSSERTVPARDEAQRIAERLDDAPAGAPEPRIDADDANRFPMSTLPLAASDASEM